MNHYQKYLNDFFSEFRPEPNYPTYPPYHTGLYLEDYFYKEYNKENIEHIFYIPVSWTTTYIQNQDNNLQEKLNSLEKDKKYFHHRNQNLKFVLQFEAVILFSFFKVCVI